MSLQTILLVLNAGLFVMVFTFGLNASMHDATYLFRRPGQLARALLAMNVLMPLFVVGLVLIFDLTPVVRFTLVALSVSPIIPVAPLRMLKAGATSASAIGVLVAASVLAIVFVPLAMIILGQAFKTAIANARGVDCGSGLHVGPASSWSGGRGAQFCACPG